MIHKVKRSHTGFTLVELMLAMAGVSVLLLAIAGVVMQIANTYNKGVTMQAVNQAGRAIVTDMRRTIADGRPFVVTPAAGATTTSAFIEQQDGASKVTGGRLCTGSYTYVWNLGVDANASVSAVNIVNKYSGSDASTLIRFVKVVDTGGSYCQLDAHGNYPAIVKNSDTHELLSASNLAIQCVQVDKSCDPSATASIGDNTLYYISMLVSNADQTTLTTAGNCQPPSNAASNDSYCAVNEFDFTAEAGTGGGQ